MKAGSFNISLAKVVGEEQQWCKVDGYISKNGIWGVDFGSKRKLPMGYEPSIDRGIWIISHIKSGGKVAYFDTFNQCKLFLDKLNSIGIKTEKELLKRKTEVRNIIIEMKGNFS